jgi:uncharacterized protein
MKLVLVVLAVIALWWLLRRSLRRHMPPPRRGAKPGAAQPILACAHCGLHLPRDEALPGRGGVFCSAAHRTAFEKANPVP